jgi:hypothetical protein
MCSKHHGLKNRRKLVGFHENQKGPGFQVCQKWVSWIKKNQILKKAKLENRAIKQENLQLTNRFTLFHSPNFGI